MDYCCRVIESEGPPCASRLEGKETEPGFVEGGGSEWIRRTELKADTGSVADGVNETRKIRNVNFAVGVGLTSTGYL